MMTLATLTTVVAATGPGKGTAAVAVGVLAAILLIKFTGSMKQAWFLAIAAFDACLIIFPPGRNNPKPLPDNPDDLNPAAWLWKEFKEDLAGEDR